ncbi:hypothetical protein SKAU_G00232200 [Synaphobranchus kaupii]|uniref:CCHC-type domain-containing protein n=1 Tax=Synaphobranchus kaupii TaxID=118154 RepID=A0A9Q1ITE0_SYNKA|nr:hypothetical protein SKAU_G00232200 [Synaphobranchus kaupii]
MKETIIWRTGLDEDRRTIRASKPVSFDRADRKSAASVTAPARAQSPSPTRSVKGLCFQCGGERHYRRDCSHSPSPSATPQPWKAASSSHSKSPVINVSHAESSGPSLFIELKVSGVQLKAVVDTGAEATIMSEETYKLLPDMTLTSPKRVCLRNAETGKEIMAMGGVPVQFQFQEQRPCSGRFVTEPILAYITEGAGPDDSISRIILEHDTTIPPECQCLVWGIVNDPKTELPPVLEPHQMMTGRFSALKHHINKGAARPVRQPVRRTTLGFQGEEEKHLQMMLDAGIVVLSSSEWSSPIVLVRKKDGGVRWSVDYRQLNDLTNKDVYPQPKSVP